MLLSCYHAAGQSKALAATALRRAFFPRFLAARWAALAISASASSASALRVVCSRPRHPVRYSMYVCAGRVKVPATGAFTCTRQHACAMHACIIYDACDSCLSLGSIKIHINDLQDGHRIFSTIYQKMEAAYSSAIVLGPSVRQVMPCIPISEERAAMIDIIHIRMTHT